jgi:hypothetical protein
MSVIRPRAHRFFSSLFLATALFGFGLGRPAEASQSIEFSQVFTLSEACLGNFDAFGGYWSFDGNFFLDTSLYFDYWSDTVQVNVFGYADGRGRNYRLGTSARLEIFFNKTVEGCFDPVDGVLRAKVPFWIYLRGSGGGWVPAQMRLAIYQEGAQISGITIGSFYDY